MKNICLILLLTLGIVSARNIRKGSVNYYISAATGWQYTSTGMDAEKPLPFFEFNQDTKQDSLIGSAQPIDFYAGPLMEYKLGARLRANHLRFSFSLAYPDPSAPKHINVSPLMRGSFEYQYTFFRKMSLSPHLFLGVGFHRFTAYSSFSEIDSDITRDVIYTGKFYHTGTGIDINTLYPIRFYADCTIRWTQFQNLGIGTETSFPVNRWGTEVVGTIGIAWEFL